MSTKTPEPLPLAERIEELRWRRRLTISALSREAGVSRVTIYAILNPKSTSTPTLPVLARLAAALEVPLAELIGEPEAVA